jgi:hypothetical protein
VSAKTSALAARDAGTVKNKAVAVGICFFGGDWQQLAAPI